MANHKSAIKRARQNDKRRVRNSSLRAKARTEVKKALDAIKAAATSDDATKALRAGERALYKAVGKGVIAKETASRKVSRMALAIRTKFRAATSTSA